MQSIRRGTEAVLLGEGRNLPETNTDWDIIMGRGYAHYCGAYGELDHGFGVKLQGRQLMVTVPMNAIVSTAWEVRTAAGISTCFSTE